MKMSTRGRYGLRVMIELAANYGKGPLLVDTIAKRQGISGKYIHVLVSGLKSAGLIRAVRGPSGGYEMVKPPESVTALDVVSVLEGPSTPVACVTDASSCPRSNRCPARDVWTDVAAAVDRTLSGVTLEQLAQREIERREDPCMYHI